MTATLPPRSGGFRGRSQPCSIQRERKRDQRAVRRTPSAGAGRGSWCTRPGRVPCRGRARPPPGPARRGPGPPGALALGAGQPRPILGKPTPAVPFNAVAAGFGGSALPETARPVARGPCAAAVGPSLHCAITGLPGRQSEQGSGRRHVSGLCPPDHIGPQPPMRGIHPHPDIVHDPQDPAALQSPRRSCNRPRRSRCDDRGRSPYADYCRCDSCLRGRHNGHRSLGRGMS
jgi:hypothetical protein